MFKYCGKAVVGMGTSLLFMLRSFFVNRPAVLNRGFLQVLYRYASPVYYTAKNSFFNLFLENLYSLYTGLITKITIYINYIITNTAEAV